MDNKIANLITGIKNTKQQPISNSNWKYFTLTELFELDKSGGRESSSFCKDGNINLVIAGKSNNAISTKKISGNKKPFMSNRIVLIKNGDGAAGLAFYQGQEFYATTSVFVLKSKYIHFDKYIGLFFVSTMKKFKLEFNHSNGINESSLNKMKIKLPALSVEVNESGNTYIPDYDYIKKYIIDLMQDMKLE